MTKCLKFLMVVSDPEIAAYAAQNGVDRLFVDLEVMGKQARQGHLDTWKTALEMADVARIRDAAPGADLMVRINPPHPGSPAEIDAAIAAGADVLMLPMFRTVAEFEQFQSHVAGRVKTMPLVETKDALSIVPQLSGLDEIYFGLNDLSLDTGLDFMFQPLAHGDLDMAAAALQSKSVPFGIGGIARAGQGDVPPEMILGEHVRLGSEWVILSRGFHGRAEVLHDIKHGMDFPGEVAKLTGIYDKFQRASVEELDENRLVFIAGVEKVATAIRARK